MLERLTDGQRMMRWSGSIPLRYKYTHGVAGERFFRELLRHGRITGTRCAQCRCVYLPPRLYCSLCFTELDKWVDMPSQGHVYSVTKAYRDRRGNPLPKPVLCGIVKFHGVTGGLIHRFGGPNLSKITVGSIVAPVLRKKGARVGSLEDIRYFRLVQKGRS